MKIIIAQEGKEQKNTQLYLKAITKGCISRGIDYQIHEVNSQEELEVLCTEDQFIVLEPCKFIIPKGQLNLETNITAKVVREFCRAINLFNDNRNVLIINRSKLIGRPLADMLLDDDFTVTVAHSKSNIHRLIESHDIIVCATGQDLGRYDFSNKHVIDVGNDYKEWSNCCTYIGMRDVGKMTTRILLDNVERR